MKKEYIIFNNTMAGKLMASGFVLKRMGKSHKNPNLNIFFFNESEDLLKKIEEIKAETSNVN
jgi:hypothetical protein